MNLKAAIIAGRLLESDMEFHSVLQSTGRETGLTLYGSGLPQYPQAEAIGTLEIWWTIEIEAREWGIKDITPFIKKLVLDGHYEIPDAEGDMVESNERFHYEYPEQEAPKRIGPDVDAPTPENVLRLARPNWKLDYKLDKYKDRDSIIAPEAEVDLRRSTIEIKF